MARVVVGFLIALALLGAGAAMYLGGPDALRDPCLARCGDKTECRERRCVPVVVSPSPEPKPAKRRGGRAQTKDGLQPELKLLPGDEKIVASGDALGRPEHVEFVPGDDNSVELSQDDIDRVWHRAEPAISRCITDALGDWPLEHGTVDIGFRIEKSGSVRKVRISAPHLISRTGGVACIRSAVTQLEFPSSGGASVVNFPFAIR